MSLGCKPFGLRTLSLLCGIASIGLIAILGRRLPGARWCGLLAAAGMAVGQQYVYYSQEARSYAFYSMLVVLLVLWVEAISRRERDRRLWIAGFGLMLLLAYTHYIGPLYVAAAVLTLLLCKLETRTKVCAVTTATAAALLFVPWLVAISSVYKEKHGIGKNLDCEGQVSRKQTLRRSPVVLALAIIAVLPPVIVYFLSSPPVNLPIFGFRHLLPSTAVLLLLCCYGLERLSQTSGKQASRVAFCGSALLLVSGASWTFPHPILQGSAADRSFSSWLSRGICRFELCV